MKGEGCMNITDVRVRRVAKEGREYRDIAHPINSATRERIQNIILEKYEQVLAEEPLEESAQ